MNRIIKLTLFLFVGLLLIAAPTSTLADKGEDERAMLAGSVWLIPNWVDYMTISSVKPDGSVEAHWGFASKDTYVGSYQNGRLELKNQRMLEAPIIYPQYGRPSETITATISGSTMTGHYSHITRGLGQGFNEETDFTGYCVNCFGYGPVIAIVTIGTVVIGGGIVLLKRRRKKNRVTQSDDPSTEDSSTSDDRDADSDKDSDGEEEDKSCGARFQKVVAAIDDYKRHARIIKEVIEERRSIATAWNTINALEPEIEAAEDDYRSHLKRLFVLETLEQVNDWGGDALVWGGGMISGAVSRLASVRAGQLLKLVETATRLNIPPGAMTAAQASRPAQAALLTKVSNLATLLGFFAAMVATGAHFAPKKRKSLEDMYQGILRVRMELEKAKMELRIRRQKLGGRRGLTLDDQVKRYNRVDALRQRLNQGCPDERAEIKRLIGPNMEALQDLHGLKPGWENIDDPNQLEDTSGMDEWRFY